MAKLDLDAVAAAWQETVYPEARDKAIRKAVESAAVLSAYEQRPLDTREGTLGLLLACAHELLTAGNTPTFVAGLYHLAGIAIAAAAQHEHGMMRAEEMVKALAADEKNPRGSIRDSRESRT